MPNSPSDLFGRTDALYRVWSHCIGLDCLGQQEMANVRERLKVIYMNARSLNGKMEEVQSLVYYEGNDVISVMRGFVRIPTRVWKLKNTRFRSARGKIKREKVW